MKVFLSSRYSRRDELRTIRTELQSFGYDVVCRWLDTEWNHKDDTGSSAAPPEYRAEYAVKDLEDVRSCDVLVAFAERVRGGRGGRHVEMGAALALGKHVIVVGWKEHIFHEHPSVRFVFGPTEGTALYGLYAILSELRTAKGVQ